MKRLLVRLLISFAIGGGMLYLAGRSIDFGTTWSALLQARWWVLAPYFCCMAAQHLFRAWRWGYLLAPIHPVPFSRLLPAATIGFAALIALPLRMGELVRPYLITSPELRMTQALGTLAVERVFDGLFLALSCIITLTLASRRAEVPSWLMGSGVLALGVFLAALATLVMVLWQRERAVSLCRGLFGRISVRLGERLGEVADGVVEGFRALPDWRRMLPFAGASAGYWLLNGVAVWVLSLGFQMSLPVWAGLAVVVIVGIGIMIPAGPGFIGNFELFADGALGLYVSRATLVHRGAAFIITFHATNVLWYGLTGVIALLSPRISLQRWRSAGARAHRAGSAEQNQ